MIGSTTRWQERTLHELFLLNVVLQIFDGVATYQGLHLGFGEANPLLRSAFTVLGVDNALMLFKAQACGILFLLHQYRHYPAVRAAAALVALVHLVCSFIPWNVKLLSLIF